MQGRHYWARAKFGRSQLEVRPVKTVMAQLMSSSRVTVCRYRQDSIVYIPLQGLAARANITDGTRTLSLSPKPYVLRTLRADVHAHTQKHFEL